MPASLQILPTKNTFKYDQLLYRITELCKKKKKLQQLKSKKKKAKKKQFRAILEIDMLKWLKLTGKLSSSKLLMYFRSSDTRFCLEIMFLKPNTHCRSQYSFKD